MYTMISLLLCFLIIVYATGNEKSLKAAVKSLTAIIDSLNSFSKNIILILFVAGLLLWLLKTSGFQ